ncbi:hypothetical protein EC973_003121 [Apophysomyces ossiformis]|uniref:Uncharacterized protein n=1 Tax=Apophysomyces ossiformis TaxID=679940 RepID=A0A8H7BFY0_9FUNG|nr:hypothetical protein EC973_003121 [Apophysomyces ossiformis]
MDVSGSIDRKRKADELEENDVPQESKKQLLEETKIEDNKPDVPVKIENEEPKSSSHAAADKEEPVKEETKLELDHTSVKVKVENTQEEESGPSVKPIPLETNVPFKRLIILNVEATCDENPTNPASVQVTKLSFVVVNASNMEVLHKQQIYVKPDRTPLTQFCQQVTGITWGDLTSAGYLEDAIREFDEYIQKEIEGKNLSFCFVTHGGWVLRIQLPREARDKNIELPGYLAYCRMFDLKQEIQRWQVHHPEVSLRTTSLKDLCDTFHLEKVEGETVGLGACLTTLNVVRYLTGFRHPDVFVHPIDTSADLQQFKKEESTVIHLAGLPYEVTQGELEAWFSSNGLRPTNMWMIQPTDHSKPSISGFVIFHQHDDAMRALSLNGRCLGDRPIEVCPSSERVIEAAGNMLVSFPLQAKGRHLRPGDWNCPNCSFHNFASRRNCFKCNAENPNPSAVPPPMPAPTFNPGDWICPNHSCSFHNYASRNQCMKCGSYRPSGGGGHSAQPAPPMAGPGAGYGRPPITFRPGDWYCPNPTCGFQNFASRSTCFRCHTPNPTPPQHGGYSPQPNYNYGGDNYGGPGGGYGQGGYTSGGGSYGYGNQGYSGGHHGPPGGLSAQFRPGDWYCTAKPLNTPQPPAGYVPSGNPGMKPGDWICRNESCGFHNFAKRTHCGKCGMVNPTMGEGGPPAGY